LGFDPWTALGALGAVAAALAAWLLLQHAVIRDLPVITSKWVPTTAFDQPRQIDFEFESRRERSWEITSARIVGWRRYRLARTTGYDTDAKGWFKGYVHGPWRRSVRFDPPVRDGQLTVHLEAPPSFWVRFTIRSRVSRRSSRRVTVRMTAST